MELCYAGCGTTIRVQVVCRAGACATQEKGHISMAYQLVHVRRELAHVWRASGCTALELVACTVTEAVRRARCTNTREVVHVVHELVGAVRMRWRVHHARAGARTHVRHVNTAHDARVVAVLRDQRGNSNASHHVSGESHRDFSRGKEGACSSKNHEKKCAGSGPESF